MKSAWLKAGRGRGILAETGHNCVCPIGQVILSKKGNKKQLRELQ